MSTGSRSVCANVVAAGPVVPARRPGGRWAWLAGGVPALLLAGAAMAGPKLSLHPQQLCVQPGIPFVIELRMSDIDPAGPGAVAFQTTIQFNPSKLTFIQGVYTQSPFGMPVTPLVANPPGKITASAGINPFMGQGPTYQNAVLALLTFAPKVEDCDINVGFCTSGCQASIIAGQGGQALPGLQLIASPDFTVDGSPPRIDQCCDPVKLPAGTNCKATLPNLTGCGVIAFDNCTPSNQLVVTQFPAPGLQISAGQTVWVTLTVADCVGLTDQCQVPVSVNDVAPPSINVCPPNRTLKADNDCLARVPELTDEVQAKDNCDNPSLLTITQNPPADTDIGLGVTPVVITVTDDFGNSATCTVLITVFDSSPPKIALCAQQNIVLKAGPACNAVLPDFTGNVVAVDNCKALPLLQITQSPPPGSVLNLGTHQVTITVTDNAGLSDTCTFPVVVVDNTPPLVACLAGPPPLKVDALCQASLPDLTGYVKASDACGPVVLTQVPLPGKTLIGVGTTVKVTVTATDQAGNSAFCSFQVVTADNIPPAIVCPLPIKIPANASCQAIVPQIAPLLKSDNCTPPANLLVVQNPPFGTLIGPGVTVVTLTVFDQSGGSASCTTSITVNDDTPPVIECENVSVECTGPGGAFVGPLPVTASDSCDPVLQIQCFKLDESGNIVGLINPAGQNFPIGRTFVLCRATDDAGNHAECLFSVVVADTTPPFIKSCDLASPTANLNSQCKFMLGDLTGNVVAGDLCDPDPIVEQSPPAGSILEGQGTYLITFTVTDLSGNSDTCKAELTLIDKTDPVFTSCADPVIVKANNRCQGQVPDFLPGVSAIDNCDDDVDIVQSPAPFSLLPGPGSYVITFTATDDKGNEKTCTTTVTVVDATPPTIFACAPQQTTNAGPGCMAAVPNFVTTAIVAGDNCKEGVIDLANISQDPPAGTMVGLGSHAITIIVADNSGNESTCTTFLTVLDKTPPVLTCPPDQMLAAPADVCHAIVDPGAPTVNDNCTAPQDLLLLVVRSDGLPLNAPYPVGKTDIMWIAVDGSGNSSECGHSIAVMDVTAPLITCPPNVSINADAGACCADVDPGQATARDSCDNNIAITGVRSDGLDLDDPYCAGNTVITWTATDNAGNSSMCLQFISVQASNTLQVDIDLLHPMAAGGVVRCITFELWNCDTGANTVVEQDVTFVGNEARNVTLKVPCGAWECVQIQDRLHTLISTDPGMTIDDNQYEADFSGPNGLLGGDLNDDGHVNVLDVAIYNRQFNQNVPVNTPCDSPFDPVGMPHADINGDGLVNPLDLAIISNNLNAKDAPFCCGLEVAGGPFVPSAQGPLTDTGGSTKNPVQASFVGPQGGSWFDPANWSTGFVPGTATVVTLEGTAVVDEEGAVAAAVQVSSGGTLVFAAGTLATGTVHVAPGGALWLLDPAAALTVGDLMLDPGAALEWLAGMIHVEGGLLASSEPLGVGLAGSAALVLLDGATVAAPHLHVGPSGELMGHGTVACSLLNEGMLQPWSIAVQGDLTQLANGSILLDQGDLLTGQVCLLVEGTLTLAGGFELSEFAAIPWAGSKLMIAAPAVVGAFDAIDLPEVEGSWLSLVIGPEGVSLLVTPHVGGDLGDGP